MRADGHIKEPSARYRARPHEIFQGRYFKSQQLYVTQTRGEKYFRFTRAAASTAIMSTRYKIYIGPTFAI